MNSLKKKNATKWTKLKAVLAFLKIILKIFLGLHFGTTGYCFCISISGAASSASDPASCSVPGNAVAAQGVGTFHHVREQDWTPGFGCYPGPALAVAESEAVPVPLSPAFHINK